MASSRDIDQAEDRPGARVVVAMNPLILPPTCLIRVSHAALNERYTSVKRMLAAARGSAKYLPFKSLSRRTVAEIIAPSTWSPDRTTFPDSGACKLLNWWKLLWLGGRDSNPDTVVQSHVSYRWTTSHCD